MARSKLRLLCTSMLVAILLFLYAALLCSCKTADPEISGTMWVELSLDGQYALTNAAGQTLRYFDLLQYDGTMPVEKTLVCRATTETACSYQLPEILR